MCIYSVYSLIFCRSKGSAFNGGGVIVKLCYILFVYIFYVRCIYSVKSNDFLSKQ